LRLKKKGRPEKAARPPEPGDRKALRKRIVLSNTNALQVRDVKPLSADLAVSDAPEVRLLPVEHIDQLRAVEAFKPKQGWSFFQTPAVLLREQVKALGAEMEAMSGKTAGGKEAAKKTERKVVVGEKGSGKSVYLLQAMALAFQRAWVVINFPEGMFFYHKSSRQLTDRPQAAI
jgi:small subunit ribosomal protein S29